MKHLSVLFLVFLIISCSNKKESEKIKTPETKTEATHSANKNQEEKLTFEKYSKDGIVLNGQLQIFDEKLNKIEELEIKEISKIKILEKSTSIYNIDKSKDYCLKSNFIKIEYKGKNYIVFGRDVYEINHNENFDFKNSNNESFSVFPVTNFEMGASDDEGLTTCDDFSLLIVLNQKDNTYSTIKNPEAEDYYPSQKFAALAHDDGSLENIYNIKVVNDSLILGIKISYQEGYGSYFLRTSFKDNFSKSKITDRKRFEEESVYKQLK